MGASRVPLSPFRARLALVAFLAICGAIGTNLLVLQTPRKTSASARVEPWNMPSLVDADQLGRKALEALIGSHVSRDMPAPRRASEPARATPDDKRVGSFAPSSGSFSQVALPGGDPEQVRKATIRSVQLELSKRGYEPGTADGLPGLVTRAAVMAYEHDQGLPITAEPSPEVLAHLRHGTSAPGAAIGLEPNAPRTTGEAEQVIRTVQQALARLGYLTSRPDGAASDQTVRAIREFEMDSGLVPTGRISAPLVVRLARQTSQQRSR
jgi:peptidoglycan hydrolase-like protein with peptidoglycan-binding domain